MDLLPVNAARSVRAGAVNAVGRRWGLGAAVAAHNGHWPVCGKKRRVGGRVDGQELLALERRTLPLVRVPEDRVRPAVERKRRAALAQARGHDGTGPIFREIIYHGLHFRIFALFLFPRIRSSPMPSTRLPRLPGGVVGVVQVAEVALHLVLHVFGALVRGVNADRVLVGWLNNFQRKTPL